MFSFQIQKPEPIPCMMFFPKSLGGKHHGEFHETVIPERCKDYFIFTTFRDPFERTVAAWNSLLFQDKYQSYFIDKIGSTSFEDFVEWLVTLPNDGSLSFTGSPVLNPQTSRFDFEKVDAILQIENIEEDFFALPFVTKRINIPKNLSREHQTWDELKTDQLEVLLSDWLKADINKFE